MTAFCLACGILLPSCLLCFFAADRYRLLVSFIRRGFGLDNSDDDVDAKVVGDDDDDDVNDVSDRMSSTSSCGSEKGHMLGSRPRILGAILTREVLEQARASSCAELGDLMWPHFQRRKLLRHTSRRYRKSSRQSSRRYTKDPRFTIQ